MKNGPKPYLGVTRGVAPGWTGLRTSTLLFRSGDALGPCNASKYGVGLSNCNVF